MYIYNINMLDTGINDPNIISMFIRANKHPNIISMFIRANKQALDHLFREYPVSPPPFSLLRYIYIKMFICLYTVPPRVGEIGV